MRPLLAGVVAAMASMASAHAAVPAKDSPLGRVVAIILGSQACNIQPTEAQQQAISYAGATLSRKLRLSPSEQRQLVTQFGDGTPDVRVRHVPDLFQWPGRPGRSRSKAMKRIGTLAILALALGTTAARAADLDKNSPIGGLVGIVMAMQACTSQPTPDQMAKLQTAGEALQAKIGATDADLDALSRKFGDGKPAIGCDKFNADLGNQIDTVVAAAK